jgi:Na+/melibiose symporter-like transporter
VVPVPTPTVRRWVRRGGVVAALTVPVWVVAALAAQQDGLGEVGLTYAAIAAVAVLTLAVWLRSREDTPRSR